MTPITMNTNIETFINNARANATNPYYITADLPLHFFKRAKNQRMRLNSTNVNKIAKDWNWFVYNELKVTYHYGDNFVEVQDGWHRVNAAIKSNKEYGNNIVTLPCRIYIGLTREQELDLFLTQQDNVTRLREVDKFPSLIEKGDKATIAFVKLCAKYNIIISGFNEDEIKTHRKIGSIKRCLDIINKNGADCFEWLINIIFDAGWENKQGGFQGCLLNCLSHHYNNEYRDLLKIHLVEILKDVKNIKTLNQLSGAGDRGNEGAYQDYFLKRLNHNK